MKLDFTHFTSTVLTVIINGTRPKCERLAQFACSIRTPANSGVKTTKQFRPCFLAL
jgi:hypothetical protein